MVKLAIPCKTLSRILSVNYSADPLHVGISVADPLIKSLLFPLLCHSGNIQLPLPGVGVRGEKVGYPSARPFRNPFKACKELCSFSCVISRPRSVLHTQPIRLALMIPAVTQKKQLSRLTAEVKQTFTRHSQQFLSQNRSEERRVGKEWRARLAPDA